MWVNLREKYLLGCDSSNRGLLGSKVKRVFFSLIIFTFSNNCLSCLVRASREHMDCWGATTVQTHLPSLSWAELYTCHDSSGFAGNT